MKTCYHFKNDLKQLTGLCAVPGVHGELVSALDCNALRLLAWYYKSPRTPEMNAIISLQELSPMSNNYNAS